jgi:hypothetical protein
LGFINEHHLSKSNSFIFKQVVSFKELIYITNLYIKDPRVMMTVKNKGFYFYYGS